MPSYRASSASASEFDEEDFQGGLPRRRLRPRRTEDTEQQQPFEQDTLSALIVPSCTITISNHAEESAVPIALPENMTTVTALPVPAISQTVNEHIEIPHFRLLSPAELSALGSSKGKDKKAKEQTETMTDDAFETRHKKYEREEKRLKNREMEIVRHEMWKRKEAARERRERDIARNMGAGYRKGSVPPEEPVVDRVDSLFVSSTGISAAARNYRELAAAVDPRSSKNVETLLSGAGDRSRRAVVGRNLRAFGHPLPKIPKSDFDDVALSLLG